MKRWAFVFNPFGTGKCFKPIKNPLSHITCGFLYFFGSPKTFVWYRRPDLNRHDFRHHPLKMACLPISPRRLKLYYFLATGFKGSCVSLFYSLHCFSFRYLSIFYLSSFYWLNCLYFRYIFSLNSRYSSS